MYSTVCVKYPTVERTKVSCLAVTEVNRINDQEVLHPVQNSTKKYKSVQIRNTQPNRVLEESGKVSKCDIPFRLDWSEEYTTIMFGLKIQNGEDSLVFIGPKRGTVEIARDYESAELKFDNSIVSAKYEDRYGWAFDVKTTGNTNFSTISAGTRKAESVAPKSEILVIRDAKAPSEIIADSQECTVSQSDINISL